VLIDSNVPGGRILLAPTGSLDGDFDDARRFSGELYFFGSNCGRYNMRRIYSQFLDIAQKAAKRAIAAGIKSPLFYFADPPTSSPGAWTFNGEDDYERFVEVTLLGALAGSFDPIDVREHHERVKKEYKTFSSIGLALPQGFKGDENQILKTVEAIEAGRRVAKGKALHLISLFPFSVNS
jgi:leucyl aminopeptidase